MNYNDEEFSNLAADLSKLQKKKKTANFVEFFKSL